MKYFFSFVVVSLVMGFGESLLAQDVVTLPRPDRITTAAPVAKKSPMNSCSMLTPDGYIRIVYSQPMLRGRTMLGDQVPYGKVWRVGANEATEIFTTAEMKVGDKTLQPGAYALFAIPEADSWTLIFSSDLGQWGAYNYKEESDVLRVSVPVVKSDNPYEAFTMFFEESNMVMAWGTSVVKVPVSFVAGTLPRTMKEKLTRPAPEKG